MAFTHEQFCTLRPHLYHLTSRTNLARIQRERKLDSADSLFRLANRTELIGVQRREHQTIVIGDESVQIRDQAPLFAGNVAFTSRWSFEDLVTHLNGHVFFWPGNADGPIPSGVRHFERYRSEDPVVLVMNTSEVIAANASNPPRFSVYNSGSPRCTGGRKSPRGPETFLSAQKIDTTPGGVIEVTFYRGVNLPASFRTTDVNALLN